jgi:hypothetical protein
MPVMSGTRATMQLRHMGFTKPIIALTANAQTEDRAEALAAGCDEFATKPIRRQQLATLLTRFLPTWKEPPPIVNSPSPQAATIPGTAVDDVQVAMGSPNDTSSVSSLSSRMSPGRRKRSPRSTPHTTTTGSSSSSTTSTPRNGTTSPTKPITTTLTTSSNSTSPVRNSNNSSPVPLASPSPLQSSLLGSTSTTPFDGMARRTGSDGNDDIVLHIRSQPSPVSSSTSSTSSGGSTTMTVSTSTSMTLPTSSSSSQ